MLEKELQTLIDKNKLGEAIKYIEENYSLNDFDMQLIRIKLLKQINWKKDALKLSSKEIFLDNPEIQYERVLLLKELTKFETAISICNRFINIDKFLMQKIELLCIIKDFGTAYRICSDPKYINNPEIQKQKYIIFKKIENIVHVYDKHPDNLNMQYEKAKLLRKARFYNELMVTCDKYHDNEKIIAQKVEMLKDMNLLEEALNVTNKDEYKNMPYINSQKINILMSLNRYEEALKVANEPIFSNISAIKSQKVTILAKLGLFKEALKTYEEGLNLPDFSINNELLKKIKNEINSGSNNQNLLIEYITRLYADKIDIDMIDKSNLNEYQKTILKIGYYEKHNKKYGIYYIKKIRNNYKDRKYNTLNQLLAILSSKKNNVFKIGVYEEILNVRVTLSLIDKLDFHVKEDIQIKEDPVKKELPKVEIIEKPKKIKETKYIVSIGKKVTNTNSSSNNIVIETEQKKNTVLVKDVLKEESDEVLKYIYATLAYVDSNYIPKAMKAFDIFENMIYKEATKENVDKVLNLFKNPVFKRRFNFDIREAKIKKYIKK